MSGGWQSYHWHGPRWQAGGMVPGGSWEVEECPPPPLDDHDPDAAPDLVGEVLGWRSWVLTPQGDLMSANGHSVWRPGPNRAVCGGLNGEHDHPAPQENCGCGFYGHHESPGDCDGEGAVTGIFRAWGKIIVHPTGLRSEWAEIVCLVSAEPSTKVKRAAGYYDVPIFSDAEKALAYAREEGHDTIPEELRPERPQEEKVDVTAWQAATASYISMAVPSFPTATLTTKPSKPRPGKKVAPWKVPVAVGGIWLALLAGWLLVADWLIWPYYGACVLFGFWLPFYRLALRMRCLWREELHWGSSYHDPAFIQARDRRNREGLAKGDRCPECGWKLRK